MAIAPWIAPPVLAEYVHNAGVRIRRQLRGHTRHEGDAAAIVRACIEALLERPHVHGQPRALRHVLDARPVVLGPVAHAPRATASASTPRWPTRSRSGPGGDSHITTTIHYFDRPGDVYEYGVDSLPLFLAALRAADADRPRRAPSRLARAEVDHFYAPVVDPATGLVRADRKFSAHRDTVVNRSNAYGNTMVALLAKTIAETGWFDSPFERHFEGDYGRLLHRPFLGRRPLPRRARRRDRLGRGQRLAVLHGRHRRPGRHRARPSRISTPTASAIPIPLRYETSRRPEREVWLTRHVLPDYQGSTVWTSLGAMYLQVLRPIDPVLAARGDRPLRRADRARRDVLGGPRTGTAGTTSARAGS